MSPADASADVRSAVTDAARTHARDRYLAALLAPAEARGDLVVLAAYLGEIGRIPLLVREAAAAEIRLQWWRDALAAPDRTSGHPVADALGELARRRPLDRDLLLAPIEGRARELYEDGVRNDLEFEAYAAETEGAAIRLALAVLGGDGAQRAAAPVDHAARALASARLALTLPHHLAHGRLPLPAAYVSRARDPRGLGMAEAREAARGLTVRLAEEARAALARFRAAQGEIDARLLAAYLPVALVEPSVRAALKARRDPLLEVADISPLSRVLRLWLAHRRGRI